MEECTKVKVSVVVPVFNEAATIAKMIQRIRAVNGMNIELIVVDDGSGDGTREVLEGIKSDIDHLLFHDENRGKGAALQTAFAIASGEITVIQDADLEYDPGEIPRLIQPILDGHADVVYGSRFMGGGSHRVLYFWHYLGNTFLTLLSNAFTNLNLSDMETCYKAFRTALLKTLVIKEKRFGIEPELTAKVAKAGARIYEVGISYYGRTYHEGKKIKARDGLRAIYCILRYNLFR